MGKKEFMKKMRMMCYVEVVTLVIFSIKACFKPEADVALFGHEDFLATNNGYLLANEVRGMWMVFLAVCEFFAAIGITEISKMRRFSWGMAAIEFIFGTRLAYFGMVQGRLNNSWVGAAPLILFSLFRMYFLLSG